MDQARPMSRDESGTDLDDNMKAFRGSSLPSSIISRRVVPPGNSEATMPRRPRVPLQRAWLCFDVKSG